MSEASEQIFTNAQLVLPDQLLLGTLVIRAGSIAAIDHGSSHLPQAIDLKGDYLLPGLIDLHTDNLERQVQPRPKARFPSRSALVSHDAQCAAAGITTVLDALCIGDLGFDQARSQTAREGIEDITALAPQLKSDHFLHLRCELPATDMAENLRPVADNPLIRMISLMDHSPGVGQYYDLDYYRFVRGLFGTPPDQIESDIIRLQAQRARMRPQNRAMLLELYSGRMPLASHDDRTAEDIAENHADKVMIAEFPVTAAAARAAHQHDIQVIGGAPNIVRGGSHSGNVAAADLIAAGHLDALASDYVPASMLEAAFRIASDLVPLPQAVAMVSENPAKMLDLGDRGALRRGLRADLFRVCLYESLPLPRGTWRAGRRIA
jgi:alpha-D-ribose 1-methylphosphonate 5-triphosphate diphosphatase